ncbi:hypothetical protein [Spongiactinospora sp. TRM90649]|nr:hypothetical protein [Spongiactinospora sp. TRM90649]MDF5754948.1 hypothetical protein [Spongiactinospora sp. TRM90649]
MRTQQAPKTSSAQQISYLEQLARAERERRARTAGTRAPRPVKAAQAN